jgi:hypothetical protein
MAIQVQCDSCGKKYEAEERFAGKRIRCRACSTVFTVPMPGDGDDALSSLAALAASEPGVGHDSTLLGRSHANLPVPDDEEPEYKPAVRGYRARFNYPNSAVVDRWLQILLLVGMPVWIALTAYSTQGTATPGLTTARLGVLFFVYLVLIFPMGLKGVHLAGKDLGFSLPKASNWRALATFMPMFAIASVIWMISGGHVSGLVLGLLGGFLVSAATLWLLFHLQPSEVPAAAGYAGGMTALAVAIAAGVLIGLNALLASAMTGLHKVDSLSGSPFGMGFNWPQPAPAPVEQARPKVAVAAKPPVQNPPPVVAPPPEPGHSTQENPYTNSQQPPTNDVVASAEKPTDPFKSPNDSTAPLPSFMGVDATGEGPRAQATTVNTPPTPSIASNLSPRTTPAVPEGVERSPLVESVTMAPLDAPYMTMIRPLTPSPWAAVIRKKTDQQGQIDLIWTGASEENLPENTKPWKATLSAPYVPETSAVEKYALSPSGELLAHVSTFPTFSVLVYSFKEKRILQTIKLQEAQGDATVLGFMNDERLLVQRTKGGLYGFELFDSRAGTRIKGFDAPKTAAASVAPALSPDGTQMAIVAPDSPRPGDTFVTIFLYDFPATSPRKLIVSDLNANTSSTPTGLSFSPDGTKIAVLFEQGANGLLTIFKSHREAKPVLSQPMLPVPAQPGGTFNGSSLLWVSDDALLLYGRAVLNANTGVSLGELGVPNVLSHDFAKPNQAQLEVSVTPSERAVSLVKLKMDEIGKQTKGK